jgi:hypothetical protein
MNVCVLCQNSAVIRLRDFGRLPVCNHFLTRPGEPEAIFPFILGQCTYCGLVQIVHPVPPDQLRSPHHWITYTEPSGHLDALVATVLALPGVTRDCAICGIFLRTDPTLERFQAGGFSNTWRLDIQADLEVTDPCAGTETIQDRFQAEIAERISQKRGHPDVIIIRHVLEHAHDPRAVMEGLRRLVKASGFVVFEVPDCQQLMAEKDYTSLWEEHVSYFTMQTFVHLLKTNGWGVQHTGKPGVSLVAIAQPGERQMPPAAPAYPVAEELTRGKAFADGFPALKARIRDFLSDFSRSQGKIALFGAGHLSCTLMNLMEMQDYLCCVIDDHERKQGMFTPGSHLPICASRALQEKNIALCLSSLGNEADGRLAARNPPVHDFLRQGGELRSIFPRENFFLADSPANPALHASDFGATGVPDRAG